MSSHVTTFCHRLSHGGATLTELYSHVTRSGLESAPVLLNPRERLAKMKADLKASAASQLQAAKSQLEMLKSGTFEVSAINEAPMPKSNDMVKSSGMFDGFIDGIDEMQLEDTFQRMKRLMQQNGIEADNDFIDFEKQLSNFVEHGSTDF